MQGILYNKQTEKIINVFQDPEVIGNKIKYKEGTIHFGNGLGIIFVQDSTVQVSIVDEKKTFIPSKIDTTWTIELPPKTLEDKVKDLETIVAKLKAKIG